MFQAESFPYAAVDGHQIIELPYVGEETSMVVILPADGEFETFEDELDVDRIDTLLAELNSEYGTIELPRTRNVVWASRGARRFGYGSIVYTRCRIQRNG